MPEPLSEVFAAAQQLSQLEMVIPAVPPKKKLGQSTMKPSTSNTGMKTIQLQEGDLSKTALISASSDDK
jgi:hypothetical protein